MKKMSETDKKYCYEYERPAITVDSIIFGFDGQKIKILLIKRGIEPFKNKWAIPGGFIRPDEDAEQAAKRILKKETTLKYIYLEQLFTFTKPNRDPRTRVVSIAYFALVKLSDYKPVAGTDEKDAAWFDTDKIPKLAFDHNQIIKKAVERIQSKIHYKPIGFELLPDKFTLSQLQKLYEAIWQKNIDKRNFRKKILSMKLLKDTGEKQKNVPHKAAKFYKFDKEKYMKLTKKGFNFEV